MCFSDDVKQTRCHLWPQTKVHDEEDQRRNDAKEKERKQRAKERQQKVMEQFASQQKIFLDNIKEQGTVLHKQAVMSMFNVHFPGRLTYMSAEILFTQLCHADIRL
jgi:hypothetical protein